MRVESTVYPNKVQRLGGKALVNFLVEEKTRTIGEDTHTYYEYQQVALQYDAPESDIDKAIVRETEKILSQRKAEALDRLTVTTTSGKVFYADPISRTDMSDVIALASETGNTETYWKLAEAIDGSKVVMVTLDEMKEARMLALQAKASVIGVV